MRLKWDDESRQARGKLFAYDEQDGPSTNEVTFEAIFYYPPSCVDVQSSQNLLHMASALHDVNAAKEEAYIVQNKNLSRRIDSTSESDAGFLTTAESGRDQ